MCVCVIYSSVSQSESQIIFCCCCYQNCISSWVLQKKEMLYCFLEKVAHHVILNVKASLPAVSSLSPHLIKEGKELCSGNMLLDLPQFRVTEKQLGSSRGNNLQLDTDTETSTKFPSTGQKRRQTNKNNSARGRKRSQCSRAPGGLRKRVEKTRQMWHTVWDDTPGWAAAFSNLSKECSTGQRLSCQYLRKQRPPGLLRIVSASHANDEMSLSP